MCKAVGWKHVRLRSRLDQVKHILVSGLSRKASPNAEEESSPRPLPGCKQEKPGPGQAAPIPYHRPDLPVESPRMQRRMLSEPPSLTGMYEAATTPRALHERNYRGDHQHPPRQPITSPVVKGPAWTWPSRMHIWGPLVYII